MTHDKDMEMEECQEMMIMTKEFISICSCLSSISTIFFLKNIYIIKSFKNKLFNEIEQEWGQNWQSAGFV